jgi:hypothetical protein
MFEVKCGEETFVLDSWAEVTEMWGEIVWAEGALDAEMTVRFAPETE